MFRFAHPFAFLLLLPAAAAAWRMLRRSREGGLLFTGLQVLPEPPFTWRLRLLAAAPAFFLAGLALLIAALARPQTVHRRITRTTEAIAIQMVVDVSGSMEALDFSTEDRLKTRLDVVKELFARFVERRPDDLIGLIAFAGYPATRAPLTTDHAALLQILATLETPRTILGADGQPTNPEEALTAIGDALAVACARLEMVRDVKSKIILLLSDGESNFGLIRPEAAAQLARRLGFRIYTIGIGSTGLAPVKVRDRLGREVIARAQVTLDEALLKRLAEETGGRYFNARSAKALEEALAEVDRLEKTPVSREEFDESQEWFAALLTPGLVFIALALALRAVRGHEWI
jgi:Ca-activated chloride channel family protein